MNKSTIMWIVGGIGTAVGGYFLYKRITRPTETFGETEPSGSSNTVTPPKTTTKVFPLKRGSKGKEVVKLQKWLKKEGYDIGNFGANKDGVDGDFGLRTENAVKNNQTFDGVSVEPNFARNYGNITPVVFGQVNKEFYDKQIA